MMEFFDRVPKWVKRFPIALDRKALAYLARSSKGPLEKPREMNFVIYGFVPGDELDEALARIGELGWNCNVQPQPEDPSKLVLTAQKKSYSITEGNYVRDVQYFRRIASLYHAHFDGWFASN